MGSNTDTLGCRAGWGEEAALDPEELPAWLPPLQNIPVISVPHPAAIFYSGNTGPALAFQEVAQSQFVTANFDMEEASLAARMQDLLRATKKYRSMAVAGVEKITGPFKNPFFTQSWGIPCMSPLFWVYHSALSRRCPILCELAISKIH